MNVKLRLTGRQHAALATHLLHSDKKEAVALALCGRRVGEESHCLTVRRVEPIPYDHCIVREKDQVTWSTSVLRPLLEEAMKRNMAILKVHSHPQGYPHFSETDSRADQDLFSSVFGWLDDDYPHASAVLLPDGRLFGRSGHSDGTFSPLSLISIAGDDLCLWFSDALETPGLPSFAKRHAQAFGAGTTALLRRLSAAVVGCSGTGSIVIEQLSRLGIGRLVLVDPDRMEEKNLNRVLNAGKEDGYLHRLKVEVAARAIAHMGLGTEVMLIPENLSTPRAVKAVAECDVAFGCMDGAEGRLLLNRLSTFYSIPYFDVGVKLEADGKGGIDQICGTVHYLQPDGSSLLSRGVVTLEAARAEGLKRTDPGSYKEQLRARYIQGVAEDRPAVISVNMHYASLAVNEFLARIHSYRDDGNKPYARFGSSLTQARYFQDPDGEPCTALSKHVGRGDATPLLDRPALSEAEDAT